MCNIGKPGTYAAYLVTLKANNMFGILTYNNTQHFTVLDLFPQKYRLAIVCPEPLI